jgi:hypothetical protein
MKGKAQVTVFVIIGAMVLLAAMLFFAVNRNLNEDKPGFDTLDVSLETRPTFQLVESCLEQISLTALRKVSSQGGYIEFSGLKYNDFPYASDIVNFPPNKIPYWRHLTECGDKVFCEKSHIPPLCKPGSSKTCFSTSSGDNSIQEQVEIYIEQNIDSCLNNFESLSHMYNISTVARPDVSVTFSKEETRIILDYPLTIKSLKSSATKTVKEFAVVFDIKMTEMYDLAKEIVEFETQNNFYEEQTMNLITIYSGIDEKLPPTSEISFFDAGGKYWIQQEIKEILEYDLLPFMGTIRFMNAKNYFPISDYTETDYTKYSQGMYFGMNPKIGNDNTLYDYNIIHHYTYLPIYTRVGDGSSLLKPGVLGGEDNIIMKMGGLFLKDYRFDYDIRYPLVITINDDEALNGKGFDFNFAVEVNIRNNMPAYNNFTNLNLDVPFQTGLGDFELRLPQNISIYAKDKHTQTALEGVDVSYICGREFEIGKTIIDSSNLALFKTQLPYCEMGGYLKFTKTGYAGVTLQYDNKINGTNKEFSVELWPLKEKEIILYKRTYQDLIDIQNAGEDSLVVRQRAYHNLSENETALFSIEKVLENPYEDMIPLVGFIKYQHPGTKLIIKQSMINSNVTLSAIEEAYQQGTISTEDRDRILNDINSANVVTEEIAEPTKKYFLSLAPGNYNMDISLVSYNGISIPSEFRDPCPDDFVGNLLCDEDPILLPAQNFSIWMTGGLVNELELSPNVIYSDKKIIIYIFEMPTPTSWTDLDNLKGVEDYQVDKLMYVLPKFVD